MTTKAIIKSINYNSNTCEVRIPLLETVSSDEFIATAAIAIPPGVYNGYKVGDVVYVTFEDNQMETPIVIGKLYLGVDVESKDPRGAINCDTSATANKAEIPFDTELTTNIDSESINTYNSYTNIEKISSSLKTAETNINRMDTDFGNEFRQVASDINNLESEIKQTSSEIAMKVGKTDGNDSENFGWSLTKEDWTVYSSTDLDGFKEHVRIYISTYTGYEDADHMQPENFVTDKEYIFINGIRTQYTPERLKNELGLSDSELEDFLEKINEHKDLANYLIITENDIKLKKLTSETEPLKNVSLKNLPWITPHTRPIMVVNATGLDVSGKIEAEKGHIGKFNIGETHGIGDDPCKQYFYVKGLTEAEYNKNKTKYYTRTFNPKNYNYIYTQESETSTFNENEYYFWLNELQEQSGIYSDQYSHKFEDTDKDEGIYVGTDGIKLGRNFKVNTNGDIIASSGNIGCFNISPVKETTYVKYTQISKDEFEKEEKYHGKTPQSAGLYQSTAATFFLVKTPTKDTKFEVSILKKYYIRSEESKYASSLASDGYPDTFNNAINTSNDKTGVLISSNGIALGPKGSFNVDAGGNVSASSLSLSMVTNDQTEITNTSTINLSDNGLQITSQTKDSKEFNIFSALSGSGNISTDGSLSTKNDISILGENGTTPISLSADGNITAQGALSLPSAGASINLGQYLTIKAVPCYESPIINYGGSWTLTPHNVGGTRGNTTYDVKCKALESFVSSGGSLSGLHWKKLTITVPAGTKCDHRSKKYNSHAGRYSDWSNYDGGSTPKRYEFEILDSDKSYSLTSLPLAREEMKSITDDPDGYNYLIDEYRMDVMSNFELTKPEIYYQETNASSIDTSKVTVAKEEGKNNIIISNDNPAVVTVVKYIVKYHPNYSPSTTTATVTYTENDLKAHTTVKHEFSLGNILSVSRISVEADSGDAFLILNNTLLQYGKFPVLGDYDEGGGSFVYTLPFRLKFGGVPYGITFGSKPNKSSGDKYHPFYNLTASSLTKEKATVQGYGNTGNDYPIEIYYFAWGPAPNN